MGCKNSKLPGKVVLYFDPMSAPCRTVLLTAKALKIDLDLKPLSLMEGEHMKPKFLKINPQHCIPTLKEGDFVLWESRAIAQYLANQYAPDDSLYPKDPRRRALVDSRLNFDQGLLYQRFYNWFAKLYFEKHHDDELLKKVIEGVELLNTLLDGKLWAAGDNMTIADFALVSSVTTIECMDGVDMKAFPHVLKWLARCKVNMEGYDEANQQGVDKFNLLMKNALKSE